MFIGIRFIPPHTCLARKYNTTIGEGAVVYEPFGGSESTLIACQKIDRQCYMIEADPDYCNVIVERFRELLM